MGHPTVSWSELLPELIANQMAIVDFRITSVSGASLKTRWCKRVCSMKRHCFAVLRNEDVCCSFFWKSVGDYKLLL